MSYPSAGLALPSSISAFSKSSYRWASQHIHLLRWSAEIRNMMLTASDTGMNPAHLLSISSPGRVDDSAALWRQWYKLDLLTAGNDAIIPRTKWSVNLN